MNEFEEYRKASNEMETDPQVQQIRTAISMLQEQLAQAEYPFRYRMADATAKIVEEVLSIKKTIERWGVRATYTAGRKTTSWRSVALEMDAPPSVVARHTSVGNPSVKISLVG